MVHARRPRRRHEPWDTRPGRQSELAANRDEAGMDTRARLALRLIVSGGRR
jgi:hypothetical protein